MCSGVCVERFRATGTRVDFKERVNNRIFYLIANGKDCEGKFVGVSQDWIRK